MHELSIIQSLFETLEAQARAHGAARITRVCLRVGPLSGAVPELLEEAFQMYKEGTIADGATIEIVKPPVRVKCWTCGAETEPEDFIMKCPRCGSIDTELSSGTELYLDKIELETD
jgi:hydrogenase nickel incorporation protein HypA/HybF